MRLISILLILLTLSTGTFYAATWEWENPNPLGNFYFTSWVNGPNDVYFAGEAGTFVHYNGVELDVLSARPNPIWSDIYDLWGTGSVLYGLATGLDGAEVIVKYQGGTWTRVYDNDYIPLYCIWGTGPNNIFAVGEAGSIIHYNGTSWQKMSVPSEDVILVWVYGFSENEIYATGSGGTVWYFDGSAWTDAQWGFYPTEIVYCFWGSGEGDLIACVTEIVDELEIATIYVLEGSYWEPYFEMEDYSFYGIWGAASNQVWVAGTESFLYWNGSAWEESSDPSLLDIWDINGANGSAVYAAGRSKILKFNGTSWASLTHGFYENMYAIWGSSTNDIYAVGDPGPLREPIQHFDGMNWTGIHFEDPLLLTDVHGSDDDNVWAVGEFGAVVHYDGRVWSIVQSPTTLDFWAVWCFSSTNVFAIALNDEGGTTLYNYSNGTWNEHLKTTEKEGFYDIWASAPDDIYLCGTTGTIWHYNGSAWSTKKAGEDDIILIYGTSRGNVFAVSFSDTTVPWFYRLTGTDWVAVSELPVEVPMGLWGTSPNNIYIADAYHQVGRFDGAQWTVELLEIASYLYAIWGSNSGNIRVVGDFGAVLHSTGDLNFDLETNSNMYESGDHFVLSCEINNPTAAPISPYLYIALDVYGVYFFWPSWRQYDPADPSTLDWASRTIASEHTLMEEILAFDWPSGAGQADDILFLGVMLDPGTLEVIGNIPMCTFGFK